MAKDQRQDQEPAIDAPIEQEPPKSYRLYIALGFVSLILFEMIVLYILLPPRPVPKDPAGITIGEGFETTSTVGTPANVGPRENRVEMPIGEGPIRIQIPRDDTNEKFSFIMYVTVRTKEQNAFDKEYKLRMNEIKDRIQSIMVQASRDERAEPGLTAIKQRSKKQINEILGTPWVQQVFITDLIYEAQ